MPKTPQVTPDWNTGIYIGDGVVAEQKSSSLIDTVLDQIVRDVNMGDVTAIEEMLKSCPTQVLVDYLPERD